MKNKKYNIMLNPELVDSIRPWLKERGITFSGYLNMLLKESAKSVVILNKTESMKDVTLGQIFEICADAVEEKEKEAKKKRDMKK